MSDAEHLPNPIESNTRSPVSNRVKFSYLMTDRYPRDGASVIRLGPSARRGVWQHLFVTKDALCAGCGQTIAAGERAAFRPQPRSGLRTRLDRPAFYHPTCSRRRGRSLDAMAKDPASRDLSAIAWKVLAAVARQTQETGQPTAVWRSFRAAADSIGVHRVSLARALNELLAADRIASSRTDDGALLVVVLSPNGASHAQTSSSRLEIQ